MLAAIYGATLLDTLGRRKMLMGGLWGGLFSYILLTAFTATAKPDNNLAYGTIVSIYLFGIFFAWGWTPLQTLYAVECLENRTRAKGSGLNFLFLNIAMVVNTYGISVGIEAIGWKLYLVYIAWICASLRVRIVCRLTDMCPAVSAHTKRVCGAAYLRVQIVYRQRCLNFLITVVIARFPPSAIASETLDTRIYAAT